MAGLLHRTATTVYSCYLPVLGGFNRSWSCKTCRCKYSAFCRNSKGNVEFFTDLFRYSFYDDLRMLLV